MSITAACPHCLRQYKLADKYAGKTVKCTNADCGKSFVVEAGAVTPPVPVKPKSRLFNFGLPTFRKPPTAEQVRAKEAALAAKKTAWSKFWFRAQLWFLAILGTPVVLSVLLAWINRNKPVTYITQPTPSYSPIVSPPLTQEPATVESTPSPRKPRKDDGSHKEGFIEKLKEAATGKEIVHRKDGTTYERAKPKK